MLKIDRKVIVGFFIGVCIGALGLYLTPYFQPKNTIYTQLRNASITFHRTDWYENKLQRANYIQQIRYFESFKNIYEEKNGSLGTYDSIHVFVDPNWNVAWIEVWIDNNPSNIDYLSFYFYFEPD